MHIKIKDNTEREIALDLLPMIKNRFGRAVLSLALILFALGAWAEPCITPGDPIGCEIDTPLDTHVWVLIVASLMFSVYIFVKEDRNSLDRKYIKTTP